METLKYFLAALLIVFFSGTSDVFSVSPVGHLDKADGKVIAGWAKDDDYNGPVSVHIYIDGVLVQNKLADLSRSDVGNHAFHWEHAPLGTGEHEVAVYAIGVDDEGNPNGENPSLAGSPKTISASCNELDGSAKTWCTGNPSYWETRQNDTALIWNKNIKIGVNRSYGGMISQLYGNDHSYNYIDEHGGAAVQLSVWGYDNNGKGSGWFGKDMNVCDPQKYDSEEECLKHNNSCREWGAVSGDHVCDCEHVSSCVNWGAAAPWNPIQAQAENCKWEGFSNDVDFFDKSGNTIEIELEDPANFTKTSLFTDLTFGQKVSLKDSYAQIDYTIDYQGERVLSNHPQEIPAIFISPGLSYYFYYYDGEFPYNDLGGEVVETRGLQADKISFPNYEGETILPEATEKWWGVCNEDETKCITIASFSSDIERASVLRDGHEEGTHAYLTALGNFNISPGMRKEITVYLFPYKHDDLIAGKTVRERIYQLAEDNSICFSCSSEPAKFKGNADCSNSIDLVDFDCSESDTEHTVDLADFRLWLDNFVAKF